jgi:hypothetical protein
LKHDGHDELARQRRKKPLTQEGRTLLEEIERAVDSSGQSFEEILERLIALPPADHAKLVSIFGAKAHQEEAAEAPRREERERNADLVRSVAQLIQEAQEREQAAGKAVTPHMIIREALEILGR